LNPGLTAVVVSGTAGNDSIGFMPSGTSGAIDVAVNNLPVGAFVATGRVIAFGLGATTICKFRAPSRYRRGSTAATATIGSTAATARTSS
jgi:hypothetical protein